MSHVPLQHVADSLLNREMSHLIKTSISWGIKGSVMRYPSTWSSSNNSSKSSDITGEGGDSELEERFLEQAEAGRRCEKQDEWWRVVAGACKLLVQCVG